MQLINAPGKLVLPFAASGAKNAIPVASQIGIVAGAASLTDGFPPLTRTPLAAGGVPPSGLDMNGIIYELSAILRWANAGAGYVYDGTFAADSNVGGYPKGARVLRSDGLGYWFNTADNNTTDPEDAGAVAAGWVPDFTNGVAAVMMTGSNVTLTALQYGKPIIVISGLLTANLNLIFPSIAGEWTVINNTTGAFSVTCKTAAGTGVVVNSAQAIVGDGTNIYSAVNDAISLLGENVAHAAGTADALTAAFTPAPHSWPDGVPFFVRAASANATTTPTFTPNSGTLAAKTIVKGANGALVAGDIAGAGHWLLMQYDATLDKVVLLNPALGITTSNAGNAGLFKKADSTTVAFTKTGAFTVSTSQAITVEVNGVIQNIAAATVVTMPGAPASGTDYAVWAKPGGTLEATSSHTSPPVANSRKIGGFHYAPGGNAAAQAGGNTTPQINEYSFWDLKFRPTCSDPRGMTLVGGGYWVDIYLTGVDAITNGSSKYNVTMADGSSPPKVPTMFGGNGTTNYGTYTWFEAMELATAFGKRCPNQQEFMSAMYGTTEASSIGTDQVSTILNAVYTSKWGVIQATGVLWVWGVERGGPYAGATWNANTEGRGSEYNAPNAALFGGVWNDTSSSGSRCSNWGGAASSSLSLIGSRFVSDHLQLD
jgi:hypothetical protein